MNITSVAFLLFAFATLIAYFVIPEKFKRYQWIVLLAASTFFYFAACGWKGYLFVVLTSATIYAATMLIQSITDKQKAYFKENKGTLSSDAKKLIKDKNGKKKRLILILTLIINFGIMCVCKYAHFAVDTVNSVFGASINNGFSLIVPLGLSFYTFQATGYLVNVFWDSYKAEKNYFKVLLFVSFFPQITQGPISEFDQLAPQLFNEHKFEYKNFAYGSQRVIWGFFKKLLVANTMGMYVANTFSNYPEYTGITTFLGALCYSVQIYADFSGYMDIMCGFCEILGIKLSENFDRPYFSKSIAEYWRRWHITLGAWFKQYIYYPIAVSKWNRNLGKTLTEKCGKAVGANLPATLALILVWFTTGLWHGASWAYVAWGGVNGFFIILSMWLEPVYEKIKNALRIKQENKLWNGFQILRTFLLVTVIKVLPEVGTLSQGIGLWKHVFTNHTMPRSISKLLEFASFDISDLSLMGFALFGVLLMFIVSLIKSKHSVRDLFNKLPFSVRILVVSTAVIIILIFGTYSLLISGNGGFLYAQF